MCSRQLACDMNVNNTLALYNTHMIKSYVAIDPRVRPLIMIIKHWTKQRAINNAADGGTLSTYTWTCMIINFLQMRDPPILPVLHRIKHVKSNTMVDGCDPSFYDNVESLRNFGQDNRESLGGLLFAFFRRFAYEFDYETQVISVRHGTYLHKSEKGWDRGPNRRILCVEEPFNVDRNLGNSADDTSVQGLRREFRRAVHMLWETGDWSSVCLPYVAPTFRDRPQQPSSSPLSSSSSSSSSSCSWPSTSTLVAPLPAPTRTSPNTSMQARHHYYTPPSTPPQPQPQPLSIYHQHFIPPQGFTSPGRYITSTEQSSYKDRQVPSRRRSKKKDDHRHRFFYANLPFNEGRKIG
ncbi:hypothetical protein EC973_008728 [Apophysomyces ossiformis]|uniref:PAP-associated domain-containing protein n=1 Tax=Apophysomyces ossiformis TaxID=679940 RepID=A0A8H7BWK3_9FUNG|nr:hypothetical protein EC973_008728 [Apophysomyces ossiformis]